MKVVVQGVRDERSAVWIAGSKREKPNVSFALLPVGVIKVLRYRVLPPLPLPV